MDTTRIGTVYGVLLNDPAALARLAPAFHEPPYRAPPVAPILYVKSRNTFASDGATVGVPADPGRVRIDATIGAVIGRRATRVSVDDAFAFVGGYAIVGDLTLPHDSVYRPAVRQRCRDGFCPIGEPTPVDAFDVASAVVTIAVDGVDVHRRSLDALVRPLPRLLADVTAFMTLDAGDILLLGGPDDAPLARPGETVSIRVPGLATLTVALVAETAS